MSGADWLIVIVVLVSSVMAASQGFFFEIFSLAGVAGGYLFAAWGYRYVAAWFAPYVRVPWVADVAGFLTIFAGVVLLAGIVGRIVRWSAREAGLSWFDRLLGGVFGFARGVAIAMVVILAFASLAPASTVLARSRLAPYLLVGARAAIWVAPSSLRAQFRTGIDNLRHPAALAPSAAGK